MYDYQRLSLFYNNGPPSRVRPRFEDNGAGTTDVLSQPASDGLPTVHADYVDTVVDNVQVIGDLGRPTDDGDLICGGRPRTTLNVTEAHHVDASNSTFIQGNVFSQTTNTVTYINTGA